MTSPVKDAGQPLVMLQGVRKVFGDNVVLEDIDLEVNRGEAIVIAGPSGSGKSTLLRCVNGLEQADGGTLTFDGKLVRPGRELVRLRQDIGMVFQQFNLFPHMTVLGNVTVAPIKVRGLSPDQARAKAREVLDVMRDLARSGMTMLVVTHEMGFAREVCDRVVFIDEGRIVEEASPDDFFNHTSSQRARDFVDKIIHH